MGSSEAITNSIVGSVRPRKPNIKVTQSVCATEVTNSGITVLEVLPLVPKHQECQSIRRQIKGILQYQQSVLTCVTPTRTSLLTPELPLIISPVPLRNPTPPLRKPDISTPKASSNEIGLKPLF